MLRIDPAKTSPRRREYFLTMETGTYTSNGDGVYPVVRINAEWSMTSKMPETGKNTSSIMLWSTSFGAEGDVSADASDAEGSFGAGNTGAVEAEVDFVCLRGPREEERRPLGCGVWVGSEWIGAGSGRIISSRVRGVVEVAGAWAGACGNSEGAGSEKGAEGAEGTEDAAGAAGAVGAEGAGGRMDSLAVFGVFLLWRFRISSKSCALRFFRVEIPSSAAFACSCGSFMALSSSWNVGVFFVLGVNFHLSGTN